jgi:hypothetical protein
VCFIVCKTTSLLEYVILTTLYLAVAKNTDSWHARKGDLQRAFHLDIPMCPSSALAVSADGECLLCGSFSHGETIHLAGFDFITNYFGILVELD